MGCVGGAEGTQRNSTTKMKKMSPGSAGREETKLCFHQAREGCAMIPLLLLSSDGAGWGLCWPHCGQFEPLLILRGKSRFPLGKGDLSPVICPSIPTGSSSAQSLSCLSGGAQIRECLTTFRENRLTAVINSWQMSNNYRYIFSAFRNTRALTSSSWASETLGSSQLDRFIGFILDHISP